MFLSDKSNSVVLNFVKMLTIYERVLGSQGRSANALLKNLSRDEKASIL